jgi:hypothetical protein
MGKMTVPEPDTVQQLRDVSYFFMGVRAQGRAHPHLKTLCDSLAHLLELHALRLAGSDPPRTEYQMARANVMFCWGLLPPKPPSTNRDGTVTLAVDVPDGGWIPMSDLGEWLNYTADYIRRHQAEERRYMAEAVAVAQRVIGEAADKKLRRLGKQLLPVLARYARCFQDDSFSPN